jgi:methylenetetrahydrofolate dehydrogenase (NADP+) / methenyltetrahydrofolate cyclohydrolase
MPKILDGKVVRDKIMSELKEKISDFKTVPNLAIIKIGDNPDSEVYVRMKINFAKKIGVNAYVVDLLPPRLNLESGKRFNLSDDITQEILLAGIDKLNSDQDVHGIIVQSPLPSPLDWVEAVKRVAPEKDVDGLCSVNVKKLIANDKTGTVPATARGVLTLLNYYKIPVKDKKVVVMGRSALVGQPIANLMINNGATVTVVHSQTLEPEKITKEADILIVAVGKPELVGVEYVKEGAVVIDVGISTVINSDGTKKVYGDIDFDSVSPLVSAVSPVPGGVGPMTVASLFQNLYDIITRS